MYDVAKSGASTAKLEKFLPEIESKEISNTLLLTKCRYLESIVVNMQNHIICILGKNSELRDDAKYDEQSLNSANKEVEELKNSNKNENTRLSNSTFGNYSFSYRAAVHSRQRRESSWKTDGDSRCGHRVHVGEISTTKTCPHCIEKYKEKFLISSPYGSNPRSFFELLESGDEVTTARHSN